MKRLVRFLTTTLFWIAALALAVPFVSPSAAVAQSVGPRILESTASSVVFEFELPEPDVDQVERDGRIFDRISLTGFAAAGAPGAPELPRGTVSIGIPAQGNISVRVLDAKSQVLPGVYSIAPAPAWTVQRDLQTGQPDPIAGVQAHYALDAAAYALDNVVPPDVASLDEVAFIRQQRIARVALYPVQFNAARGQVTVYSYLRVEVSFPEAQQNAAIDSSTTDVADVFDPILRDQLLNYDQARLWRSLRQAGSPPSEMISTTYPGDTTRPWFKASVRFSGLYKITLADLAGQALAPLAAANPLRLQVWQNGQQISTQFMGDSDAVFEPSEQLLFYVAVDPDVYSDTDVIWITIGDTTALSMMSEDASPTGSVTEMSLSGKVHAEADFFYIKDVPEIGTPPYPRWYWLTLNSLFQPTETVQFVVSHPIDSGYDANLRVRLAGFTEVAAANPDHRVRVELNGHTLGHITWDGKVAVEGELQFAPGVLQNGLNHLTLTVPGGLPGVGVEEAYLDWLEITYRQAPKPVGDRLGFTIEGSGRREFQIGAFEGQNVVVYDVTDSRAPIRLVNTQVISSPVADDSATAVSDPSINQARRVFLPFLGSHANPGSVQYRSRFGLSLDSSRTLFMTTLEAVHPVPPLSRDAGSTWRAATNRADYLLVTHRDFATAAETLAAQRRSQGMAVAVVDIQDIYDEFGTGQLDPRAIHAFVDYAYHFWQSPAPSYVLLLGDGHYDYRMVTGLTMTPNYIPPYYGCFDPYVCEVAVDNEFVTVSGDDRLPDLAIGRLPANTSQAAMTMVNKIIGYENSPPSGAWRQALTFVADNYRMPSGNPDPAGNFEALTEGAIATIPASYSVRRIYYDPYPNDDGGEAYRYRTAQTTTPAILGAINAGTLFVNYIGHASTNTWANEAILQASDRNRNDVTQMANGARLPIVLDMACLSGSFSEPQYTGIEAKMLEWTQGGSVAGWGATGFGVATGHDWLHRGFYGAVFSSGVRTVGLAAVGGKLFLWNNGPHYDDLLDTFGLLGDPATRIALPSAG